MSRSRLVVIVVGLIVALVGGVAIGSSLASDDAPSGDANSLVTTTTLPDGTSSRADTGSTAAPTSAPTTAECGFAAGQPYVGGPSVQLDELGGVDGVSVSGAVYPRPDYEGDPWTQWGQGLILDDGRFISGIGDHIGVDGNSYLYEYDPESGTLAMVGDVLSYVDHQPGSWGYGKIHGQVVAGSCGEVYFATYWGTNQDIRFDESYQGDVLFRLDPEARTIAFLEAPVPQHGIPSLAGSLDGRLVFGEAIDPLLEVDDIDQGPFFVYDTLAGEVIFEGPATPHEGFRNIMIDGSGRAYYAIGGGRLAVYDPTTNSIVDHHSVLPGEWLRASTLPTADGRVFGVTDDEAALFVMEPSGEIRGLGTARGYTTTMAVHPDGDRFFYVPDAHGGAWETGAPLISVDGTTGEETVLVELNPLAEAGLGLRLGGTYSLSIDPSGDRIIVGMNAGALGAEDGFGEVVLLVVDLS